MAGTLLIALSCSMIGMLLASNVSARLRRLESCVSLLSEISGRLLHLQPTVHSLITSLAGQERFEQLVFLRQCAQAMGAGQTFSFGWASALDACAHQLGGEGAATLATLGDVLGRSDLDSQLAALALARQQLERQVQAARENAVTQSKLYRSMGVLGGAAAAIILM